MSFNYQFTKAVMVGIEWTPRPHDNQGPIYCPTRWHWRLVVALDDANYTPKECEAHAEAIVRAGMTEFQKSATTGKVQVGWLHCGQTIASYARIDGMCFADRFYAMLRLSHLAQSGCDLLRGLSIRLDLTEERVLAWERQARSLESLSKELSPLARAG